MGGGLRTYARALYLNSRLSLVKQKRSARREAVYDYCFDCDKKVAGGVSNCDLTKLISNDLIVSTEGVPTL